MMKIYIFDEIWEYTNHVKDIEPLLIRLNQLTKQSDLVIQQIIINGVALTGDFMEYLTESIDTIEEIHIGVIDKHDLLDEMIVTSSQYLESSLPEISLLASRSYQGLNDEIWNKFSELMEGLQYVVYTLDAISQSAQAYETFPNSALFLQELNLILEQLMDASSNQDNSLMADILNYELRPHLANLQGLLQNTIDSEVKRNDLQ